MPSYSLDAIKRKLENFTSGNKKTTKNSNESDIKMPFWKPTLEDGESKKEYQIRFVPYQNKNGQPFYEAAFYTSPLLVGSGFRQVAPCQFGMEDPIYDALTELSKTRQPKEIFKVMQQLRPKESYYAPIIVRGEEDKGVQVWELNFTKVKEIYSILGHADYADEDLFDPMTGRDFIVTVTATNKVFNAPNGNSYPIKEITISERKKPSKLAATKSACDDIINSVPDFEEYFKSRTRDTDFYQQMLDNALAGGKRGNSSKEEGTSRVDEDVDESEEISKSRAQIEDAFADL